MVFPTSYLPSNSQPWGREVEKRIEKTETALNRATVNNDARDNQLAAAMDRLNATVNSTKAAVDSITTVEEAVFVPGTTEINGGNIAANTIAANKISAGTMTGFLIQTSATGSRVVMDGSSDQIQFYDADGDLAATMAGGFFNGSGILSIGGDVAASDIYGAQISGTSVISDGLLSGGSLYADSVSITAGGSFGSSISTAGISNTGGISSTGTISTGGGLQRTVYSGGGTTGASVDNNGTFIRTTSSQRYKTDIAPLSILYADMMALQPCTFKRIEEVEENPETARNYPGFIAEDLADTSLDVFVFRNAEGQPEGIHYAELSAALLSALQTQNSLIENLTQRIEALENK